MAPYPGPRPGNFLGHSLTEEPPMPMVVKTQVGGGIIMAPSGQETRVVDPKTGGAKGSKLARFSLVPWDVMREVAEHYGRGSRKYEDRNWQKGYKWSLSYDALQRHLESFWNRDDIDEDPELYVEGEPRTARHIIAVVWHALALAWFSLHGKGTDDRPEKP